MTTTSRKITSKKKKQETHEDVLTRVSSNFSEVEVSPLLHMGRKKYVVL